MWSECHHRLRGCLPLAGDIDTAAVREEYLVGQVEDVVLEGDAGLGIAGENCPVKQA